MNIFHFNNEAPIKHNSGVRNEINKVVSNKINNVVNSGSNSGVGSDIETVNQIQDFCSVNLTPFKGVQKIAVEDTSYDA